MKMIVAAVCILFQLLTIAVSLAADNSLALARHASESLANSLKEKLVLAMGEGGAAGAIGVCSVEARHLASFLEKGRVVHVGRTSLRIRNPENRPDPWEEALLKKLAGRMKEGKLPPEVFESVCENGGRVFRYAKPIVVKPLCLACHGPRGAMDQRVRAALDARYPGDQAVGYRVGDLRGIISVTIEE